MKGIKLETWGTVLAHFIINKEVNTSDNGSWIKCLVGEPSTTPTNKLLMKVSGSQISYVGTEYYTIKPLTTFPKHMTTNPCI